MKKYYLFHSRGKWLILDSEDKRLKNTRTLNTSIANSLKLWYESVWHLSYGPFTNLVEPKYHRLNKQVKDLEEAIKKGHKKYNVDDKLSQRDIRSLENQKNKLEKLKKELLKKFPHYFI